MTPGPVLVHGPGVGDCCTRPLVNRVSPSVCMNVLMCTRKQTGTGFPRLPQQMAFLTHTHAHTDLRLQPSRKHHCQTSCVMYQFRDGGGRKFNHAVEHGVNSIPVGFNNAFCARRITLA